MKNTLTALIFCLTCAMSSAFAKTPGEVEIGQVLREAQMQGLMTKNQKLSDFRGKPLLINVWASWCGPVGAGRARPRWVRLNACRAATGASNSM